MTMAAGSTELDTRTKAVAEQLRCLVCQNQTIAESNSELALDLKAQIREQLQQGRTEAQITDFMAQRYGDYVLYKPPVNAATAVLWATPAALLVGGGLVMAWAIRSRGRRGRTQTAATQAAP